MRDGSIDADKARVITDISQVAINTAKVEIDYLKLTGGRSAFLDQGGGMTRTPATPTETRTQSGTKRITQLTDCATVTTHKLAG